MAHRKKNCISQLKKCRIPSLLWRLFIKEYSVFRIVFQNVKVFLSVKIIGIQFLKQLLNPKILNFIINV